MKININIMRRLLFYLIILCSGNVFSQPDSSTINEGLYSVSFQNDKGKTISLKEVRNIGIDSVLTLEKVISASENKFQIYSLPLEKIISFGFKSPSSAPGRGALIGFGVGLVLGFSTGAILTSPNTGEKILLGILGGGVGVLPGLLIGSVISAGSDEYKITDVSKYDNLTKTAVIKRLVRKGIEEN